jgi:ubiquinone/menaquinone biosynthesis C-methylase UbiE
MIPRVLEPEVMDTSEDASDYDAMDHAEVNRRFVDDLLAGLTGMPQQGSVLDVGTGTAQIPIELARRGFVGPITGIDLAREMLALAQQNVDRANLPQIRLEHIDAKHLPYATGSCDIVMSNSIIHHIPRPEQTFIEMRRVLKREGLLFVRDLLRPDSAADVEDLVWRHAGRESPRQQQLFRQSLHAALSLDELRTLLEDCGIDRSGLAQTSDRHWTLCWRRSAAD